MWTHIKNSLMRVIGNEGRSIHAIISFSDQDVKAIRLATGRDVDEKLLLELVYSSVEEDLHAMYLMLEKNGVYFNEHRYDTVKQKAG